MRSLMRGPSLLNRFTLHRDGVTPANTYTVPAETTKYRGLHVAAQGKIERTYIRDLLRHQVLVERGLTLENYDVNQNTSEITARLSDPGNQEQIVKSKYMIGSDGASSRVRELAGNIVGIFLDGVHATHASHS
jgi:phenol 2-monooxygenase